MRGTRPIKETETKRYVLLTRKAAAEYLGVSVRTLSRRTKEGKIVFVSD